MAPFHPTIQPKVHIPDITHPTFYTTTSLQWFRGSSCAPPFISSEPPSRTEPLADTPRGETGDPPTNPNRVRPSQPPSTLLMATATFCFGGCVEAKDCEVGWNKVMKAWGSSEEKLVGNKFELLFNAGLSEEQK